MSTCPRLATRARISRSSGSGSRRVGDAPLGPTNAVGAVELDELAIAVRRRRRQADVCARIGCAAARRAAAGGDRRTSARRAIARRALGDAALIPVGLAQVGAVASATLVLARGVEREPLTIDAQRDRLCDERRLAPLRR